MKLFISLASLCGITASLLLLGAQERVPTAEELYQRGLTLYRQGQYEAASKVFSQALSQQGKSRDADYQRGLRRYEQGDYQGAQEAFQKALERLNKLSSSPAQAAVPPGKAAVPATGAAGGEYTLSSGDILSIKVWQNPDLDDDAVIIRPDGMVSFSLVGDVAAAGKTIGVFRQDLTAALKEFIRAPQVSVSIKQMGGKRVIILGQVKSPGVYMVSGSQTILEAMGMAGGFTDHAVTSSVILVRGGFEKPQPQRLDLNRALKKGVLQDNIVLTSNDIIYVPKRFIADVNYFLSQFLEPISRGLYIKDQVEQW